MASIHKRKNAQGKELKYYRAAYEGADGKMLFKSTKRTNQKEAQALADEWEREEKKVAGADDDTQRAMAELVAEAKRLATLGQLTIDTTRELLEKVAEIGTQGRYKSYTAQEWFDHWKAERASVVSEGTTTEHTRMVQRFLAAIGDDAGRPLFSIDEDHVRTFKASLTGRGSTKNIQLSYLSACLADAVTEGRLKRNVAKAVPRFSESDSEEVLPFTTDEIRKLHKAAEGEYKGWLLTAFFTGMRAGDCAKLVWRSVDLVEGMITVTTQKKQKRVRIPIHPQLREFLEELPSSDDPDAYVFPKLALKSKANLSTKFSGKAASSIMSRAGVPRIAFVGADEGKRSFHSIRHANISALHELGIPEEDIMAASAHSDKAVHGKYNHSLGQMKERIAEVPTI